MCQCAFRGCKRKVWCRSYGGFPTRMCYRHNFWYVSCHQSEYAFRCTTVFPVFSAEDVMIWLEWIGA